VLLLFKNMKKLTYPIIFAVIVFALAFSVNSQAATVTNCAITANTFNIKTGATSTIKIGTGCQSSVIKLKTNKSNSKDLITQDDLVKIIGLISKYGMPDYDSVSPEEIAYYMAKNEAAAVSAIVEEGNSGSSTSAVSEKNSEDAKNWLVYLILAIAIAGIAWFFVMWKGEEK
jgi:hypothetical protein